MSRIRSIHPGLFTDEAFVVLSPMARVFFMGLWTECDDYGSFEWSPLKLKMRLLPADPADAAALLDEIERERGVMRYEHGGRTYGAVRNFCQYQRPKKPTTVHPQTEEVREWVNLNARNIRDGGGPVPNQLPTGGEKPRQMEDGGGDKETSSGKPERSKARKRAAPAPEKPKFEIPDWVPVEPWQAFVEMRREMERGPKKIPFTVGAAKGIVAELEEFRGAGHDIAAILMKSAINSYRGVFAPDQPPSPKGETPPAMTEAERVAYAASIAAGDKPWLNSTPRAEPARNNGPPRPIGQLVAGIAGNVQH
jgi:hypothetical protein